MNTILTKFPKLLHGGDYNPDQWLDCKDILRQDIELMKQSHVNCVSLGIFAWATLEPEEGVYQLDWMEEIIDNLYQEGIYTILATPTGAMPNWMTTKYEEVRMVSNLRVRALPGTRHNFCYTSPVMREKTRLINTQLAKRFGKHPGVILWHISNELGGNNHQSSCHCPLCQSAFREWLKEKYKTLDALNAAWWTKFWSHSYTDWEQINSPSPIGETSLHGLNLDFRRFTTARMLDFYQEECRVVEEFSDNLPVTTNMMEFFYTLDYFKFRDFVDIVSWDSYPEWHAQKDEIHTAVHTAVFHNVMRSLKKAPFLLMESTPSIVNWKKRNTQKRPGMHMLSSMQAVAHGSNSVQYFQWRKSRGSFEKFHGAVVGHDGTGNTRTFADVTELGVRLEDLSNRIYETINKPEVAIIFDWENWWAIDDAAGPLSEMNYRETIESHYRPFWDLGIDVDFVDQDQDLSEYKLVIAPMIYLLKKNFIDKLKDYVKGGGQFVTTYWSGMVDETDLCYLGGFPGMISEVLGIQSEEIDVINEFHPNEITYKGKSYQVQDLCDLIHLKGAEELGHYEKDYYSGQPAITKNTFGAGNAYYIASRNEEAFQTDFYKDLVDELSIERNINTRLPYGVTVNKRKGIKDYLFVQNYNAYEVSVHIDKTYTIEDTMEEVTGRIILKPYDCMILS